MIALTIVVLFLMQGYFGRETSQMVFNTYCSVGSSIANGICIPVSMSYMCFVVYPYVALAPGNCTTGEGCCYIVSTINAASVTPSSTKSFPTTTQPTTSSFLNNYLPIWIFPFLPNNQNTIFPSGPFTNDQPEQCGKKHGLLTTAPSSTAAPVVLSPLMPTERVIDGDLGGDAEYCWHADILKTNGQYLGSGSLIKRQWVLTAAHILKSELANLDLVRIRLGSTNLMTTTDVHIIPISRVEFPTNYNPNSPYYENDLALIKLTTPANLSVACLLCLPTEASQDIGFCHVAGRGSKASKNSFPSAFLSVINLTPVPDDICAPILKTIVRGTSVFNFDPSYQCAIGSGGQDTCTGDGGAALTCKHSSGQYFVQGVTSWGVSCGENGMPAVYSRVSTNIKWINQKISEN